MTLKGELRGLNAAGDMGGAAVDLVLHAAFWVIGVGEYVAPTGLTSGRGMTRAIIMLPRWSCTTVALSGALKVEMQVCDDRFWQIRHFVQSV
jgi:hypothetical protein